MKKPARRQAPPLKYIVTPKGEKAALMAEVLREPPWDELVKRIADQVPQKGARTERPKER